MHISFLDLPAEVRNIIYHAALVKPTNDHKVEPQLHWQSKKYVTNLPLPPLPFPLPPS